MKNFLLLSYIILLSTSCNWASDFPVIVNGKSDYAIVTPAGATPNEIKAARILQQYIRLSTGLTLPITKENAWKDKPAFFVGKTEKANKFNPSAVKGEGYLLAADDRDIVIYGGSGKGVVYGVYDFLELYMQANKYADEPGKIGEFKTLELPVRLRHEFVPKMVYRQAYYPQ
ncbi:MAG: glycoside hydrolase family 20 zincin-like fold domain-containing protein, partial [Bacteroidota bacterium]